MTHERPIIVRIEHQECVSYSANRSVIKNVGVDKDGQRWEFYNDHIYSEDGTAMIGSDYRFRKLQS